ncbi:hypothetical protein EMPS_00962 [Entomortierella parvispora]|uniref:Rap-GAP domain-containing protein n=1 Tax=Entomortierella parvispora TaxID=205924 RepID=A0A9P3H1X6_9FUNG|nr:hypothetical protein EMPS_00962 [Entomortierella parvispora]
MRQSSKRFGSTSGMMNVPSLHSDFRYLPSSRSPSSTACIGPTTTTRTSTTASTTTTSTRSTKRAIFPSYNPLSAFHSGKYKTTKPASDVGCYSSTTFPALLQDRECDLDFYCQYFRGQNHSNYVAATSPQGPIIVSIAVNKRGVIRILIRTTQGSERIEKSMASLSIPWFRRAFGVSHLMILGLVCPALPIDSLQVCQNPGLPQELARMEERQIIRCYKFGVYHLLPGQTTEYQGLSNAQDSCTPAFTNFMHWLGEPIRLCGWKGYRAGLDVAGDTTGETSIFRHFENYQVMYHCAPLLPCDPQDLQQIERRRFIGNDIVVIVFKENDDDEQFDLTSVGSRQNHIICVVRPIPGANGSEPTSYRIKIAVKDGIRNFSPLDFPSVLTKDDASRDLLLLKLICGERAAYSAKAFATQLLRTRESLLRDVIESYR